MVWLVGFFIARRVWAGLVGVSRCTLRRVVGITEFLRCFGAVPQWSTGYILVASQGPCINMGGCQNYGPFLDPYFNNTAPNIWGAQKRTIILTTPI